MTVRIRNITVAITTDNAAVQELCLALRDDGTDILHVIAEDYWYADDKEMQQLAELFSTALKELEVDVPVVVTRSGVKVVLIPALKRSDETPAERAKRIVDETDWNTDGGAVELEKVLTREFATLQGR